MVTQNRARAASAPATAARPKRAASRTESPRTKANVRKLARKDMTLKVGYYSDR